MRGGDPILEAKTVTELIEAINTTYHLQLPTGFPPGTDLELLWTAAVEVTKGPEGKARVLYQANGTEPIPITDPAGTVRITVEEVPTKEEARPCHHRPKRKARRARRGER